MNKAPYKHKESDREVSLPALGSDRAAIFFSLLANTPSNKRDTAKAADPILYYSMLSRKRVRVKTEPSRDTSELSSHTTARTV